jgi:hypothetical protein
MIYSHEFEGAASAARRTCRKTAQLVSHLVDFLLAHQMIAVYRISWAYDSASHDPQNATS